MFYLVHYNRHSSTLVTLDAFEDRKAASRKKLDLEISLLGKDDGDEFVVLQAKDEDELRRSHSRYFIRLEDFRLPQKGQG